MATWRDLRAVRAPWTTVVAAATAALAVAGALAWGLWPDAPPPGEGSGDRSASTGEGRDFFGRSPLDGGEPTRPGRLKPPANHRDPARASYAAGVLSEALDRPTAQRETYLKLHTLPSSRRQVMEQVATWRSLMTRSLGIDPAAEALVSLQPVGHRVVALEQTDDGESVYLLLWGKVLVLSRTANGPVAADADVFVSLAVTDARGGRFVTSVVGVRQAPGPSSVMDRFFYPLEE